MTFSTTEREGVGRVNLIVIEELHWIFREQTTQDWGIDAQIEVVDDNRPTGRLIAAQIKAGRSWFQEETDLAFVYRGRVRHIEYWRRHSLPVVLILYDPDSKVAYWALVDENAESTGDGWKILVRKENRFGQSTAEKLRTIALPQQAMHHRYDYLSSLMNGFAAHSHGIGSRIPIVYATLFSAVRGICAASPLLDSELLNALAIVSASIPVRLAVGRHGRDDDELREIARRFPSLDIRSPSRAEGDLHAKILLIDSALSIASSGNLTRSGIERLPESFVASTDPRLVSEASRWFDVFWQKCAKI